MCGGNGAWVAPWVPLPDQQPATQRCRMMDFQDPPATFEINPSWISSAYSRSVRNLFLYRDFRRNAVAEGAKLNTTQHSEASRCWTGPERAGSVRERHCGWSEVLPSSQLNWDGSFANREKVNATLSFVCIRYMVSSQIIFLCKIVTLERDIFRNSYNSKHLGTHAAQCRGDKDSPG